MAQDYNVDDILEEIRRKKNRETPQSAPRSSDTYGGDYPPTRSEPRSAYEEDAAPRRASRSAYPQENPQRRAQPRPEPEQQRYAAPRAQEQGSGVSPLGSRRGSRPSAFPVRAHQQTDPERPAQRYADPERPAQRYADPERPAQRYADPERPAQRYADPERPAQRYADPERPAQRYADPERPAQRYAEPERPAQRYAEPERPAQRYADPERPAQRYAEPERPAQRYADPERPAQRYAEPERYAQPYEDPNGGYAEPESAVPLQGFSDSETATPRARSRAFDFDATEPERPQESLEETMSRVRQTAPQVTMGDGFTFRDLSGMDKFAVRGNAEENFDGSGNEFRFEADGLTDLTASRGHVTGETQEVELPPQVTARRIRRERRARNNDSPENIVRSQWQQGYDEQEGLEQEDSAEDDFTSPEDAPYVGKDLKSIRVGLAVKTGLTAVLMLISIYLAFSMRAEPFFEKLGFQDGLLFLPRFMWPEEHMRTFMIVNVVVCIVTAIACSNIVGGGIAALFRLKANSDTPAALAVFCALMQSIVLAASPVEYGDPKIYPMISLYIPVAAAALLFNLIGKLMLIRRVERNFNFLISEGDKTAFIQIQNRDLAREFSKGLGPDVDKVVYTAKAGFLTGFLDKSYAPDYSETFSRFIVPFTLAGGVAVGVITFIFAKELAVAISAFAAVLCVTAPFSSAIMPNLKLSSVSKKLTKDGAMLIGHEAAEDLDSTGAVIVSDRDLFKVENVMLHGMKVFAEKRIDEAILDAASVILACDGVMSGVFLNMIGGNRRLLKKVDSIVYEDSMGISAWVDSKRVLIGSSELMRNHGVECPSRDFEARYVRDGRQVLYISNSGELSAMFVVSYNGDPETAELLTGLERRGMRFAVYSNDPNVTSELIAAAFGVKRGHVKVLPAKLHPEYAFLAKPKERVSAGGVHAGGLVGIVALLRAAGAVRHSVARGTIVQLIGTIAGYGLVAFMSFTGSLSLAGFLTLLCFNTACLVLTVIVSATANN